MSLNVGCIPSKALITAGHQYRDALEAKTMGINAEAVSIDFKATQKWKNQRVVKKLTKGIESLLKKNKVDIIKGTAFFNDTHQLRVVDDEFALSYSFDHAIIATGSRPSES